jgi:hypothetical protein
VAVVGEEGDGEGGLGGGEDHANWGRSVKEVNAQKLLKEFENIAFKDGESIDAFGMRITNLVGNLKTLGENIDDVRVVKKFLRVVPPRFTQVVVSIEMLCNLKDLTVEELIGRLRAAEERFDGARHRQDGSSPPRRGRLD